jgi:hypothetical protein
MEFPATRAKVDVFCIPTIAGLVVVLVLRAEVDSEVIVFPSTWLVALPPAVLIPIMEGLLLPFVDCMLEIRLRLISAPRLLLFTIPVSDPEPLMVIGAAAAPIVLPVMIELSLIPIEEEILIPLKEVLFPPLKVRPAIVLLVISARAPI